MFVFSLKYNVFPVKFVAEMLRQLFKDFLNRLLSSETHFFSGHFRGGEEKNEVLKPAAAVGRSCYQAAQWLWLSILISV